MIKKLFITILLASIQFGSAYSQLDSLRAVVESPTEWNKDKFEALERLVQGVTQKNVDSAHVLAEKGLELAQEYGNKFYEAQFYRRLGIAQAEQGNLSGTITNFLRSVELFEELGDSTNIGGMYLNIGVVYSRIGMDEKGMEYYIKSLDYADVEDSPEAIALAKNNIAFSLLDLDRYKEAEQYALEAQRVALTIESDSSYYYSTYSVLAQVYIRTDQPGKGKRLYEDYLDYAKRQGRIDQLAKTSLSYGQVLLDQLKDPRSAMRYCNTSLDFSRQLGLLAEEARACECISRAYEDLGAADSALHYLKLGVGLFDSLEKNSSASKVEAMVLTHDQARQRYSDSLDRVREQELAEAQLTYQQQIVEDERKKIYYLIGGVGILGVLLLLIFNAYRGKKKANDLIVAQKEEIEHTRKKTVESINYADRIQRAFLPEPEELRSLFKDSFIYYKPRDIVSGDFYWFEKIGDKVVLACADCTGHGVPGGFLSIVGHVLLNQTIREKRELDPGKILTCVHEGIKDSLGREGGADMQEGMDISIVIIDQKENELHFSGAGLGIYLARESGVDYLKPSPFSLGGITLRPGRKIDREYQTTTIPIEDGGWFYMFSDGYVDQFGGPKEEKYNLKRFKENIEKHKDLPGIEQKRKFVDSLLDWQGSTRQNDDILLIGVRV